jgi:hypothetical protein
MIVVSHTTTLSVLGAGMALRGPDGSMMTATDGLYEERMAVFQIFGLGLACTVGSVVMCVWLILHWESAFICMLLTLTTCRVIYKNYKRVTGRFGFDENETVDFRDIMEGPAFVQVIPRRSFAMGHSQSTDSFEKARSVPTEFESHVDIEWQGRNQRLINENDIKRRGRTTESTPSKAKTGDAITLI